MKIFVKYAEKFLIFDLLLTNDLLKHNQLKQLILKNNKHQYM